MSQTKKINEKDIKQTEEAIIQAVGIGSNRKG